MNTSSSATLYSQIETKSKYRFNEELKNAFKTGEIDHESVKLFCENEGLFYFQYLLVISQIYFFFIMFRK